MYKDFEDYLQCKHGELNPEILDEDIPDHYPDWLADLDVDTIIDWADKYSKEALQAKSKETELQQAIGDGFSIALIKAEAQLSEAKAENENLQAQNKKLIEGLEQVNSFIDILNGRDIDDQISFKIGKLLFEHPEAFAGKEALSQSEGKG